MKLLIVWRMKKYPKNSLSVQRIKSNHLQQNPGGPTVGLEEFLCPIKGTIIIKHIENNLHFLGGNTKLCLGQKSGIEHEITLCAHNM